MPPFRHMGEGKGATLAVEDKTPLVGTSNIITCVGLYFKVDSSRCFLAHINVVSSITYPYNVVSIAGGTWISDQVKEKLIKLTDSDKWDIKHEDFRKDLFIQCQSHDDLIWEGATYRRSARYIVRGILEFFVHCSEALKSEAQVRKRADARALRKSHPEAAKAYDDKTAHIESRAAFLDSLNIHDLVIKSDHGFVIDPRTGDARLLTGSSPPSTKEFNGFTPKTQLIQTEIFSFLLRESDRDAFPQSLINTNNNFGDRVADYQFATAPRD